MLLRSRRAPLPTLEIAHPARPRKWPPPSWRQSLEQARAAFAAAGEDVAQARGAAVDNLYGYLIAERERDGKLQKLVRMKQILARKKSLEDEGADRIARALSRERDEGQA